MPEKILRTAFTVPAPPRDVYDHLMRAENYIGLSPLVVAVHDVAAGSYVAVERFRFLGFLTHDNHIRVSLLGTPGEAVWGEVRSPGGVALGYRFALSAVPEGTLIEDTLTLRTPPGLLRYAARQAGAVQRSRAVILAERARTFASAP
ncbi:SRPBCC family protein [Actinocorallia longicatena]|uniref:SRPBCC family protein n=1 Tax=Actinocorallia longicatena TaxID=111803 RepID=A0ABP6QJ38_9ACTN